MKRMTKRQQQTLELKEHTLEVAGKLFKEEGIENVSVQEIAEEAGISIGSFYHHFGSKDELLNLYILSLTSEINQAILSIQEDDLVFAIVQCLMMFDDFLMDLGVDFVKAYYNANNTFLYNPNAKSLLAEKVSELLLKGSNQGLFAFDKNYDEVCYDIMIIQRGIFMDWALRNGSYDMKTLTEKFIKAYLHSYMK